MTFLNSIFKKTNVFYHFIRDGDGRWTGNMDYRESGRTWTGSSKESNHSVVALHKVSQQRDSSFINIIDIDSLLKIFPTVQKKKKNLHF